MATETHIIDARPAYDHAVESARREWTLVPGTAAIGWTAHKKYFMIIPVTANGTFSQVSGTISIPGDRFEEARATIRIPVSSHSSGQAKRDRHMLGRDFFHADQYPLLSFESTHIRPIDSEVAAYEVSGLLTVRDTGVPVVLIGTVEPEPGGDRAHIALAGSIDRRDVGMIWNAVPMLKLHNDIGITIDIDIERS
ncbi:MAG: hypothetical protein AVDCRST_MAG43-1678 [uncultured Thermomicrobiales bacterium]|uniref:Lipid/polyisoprenoid-binding YceI-like domain-containing protein n=1 Tax=uncultured Thermomicrobiales bacterium TaxID=1645740 RepID=A0A6J4UTF5_9BACT|nr:MAG: hypothetical protein AVDCRST_MAG43-1678 [uncultured Thermomicrobiales bacterium]